MAKTSEYQSSQWLVTSISTRNKSVIIEGEEKYSLMPAKCCCGIGGGCHKWYTITIAMRHKKPHLPEKACLVCGRSFTWRRKWADCWDDVKYCSEKCRRNKAKERDQE